MGVAVGVGAVVALGALGAAVGGVVLAGAGAAPGIGEGADIVERRWAVGGSIQEREVGYGNARVASRRPHTWAVVGAPEDVCCSRYYRLQWWRKRAPKKNERLWARVSWYSEMKRMMTRLCHRCAYQDGVDEFVVAVKR